MRRETINIPAGQSFRLIRWRSSVKEVESLLADGGRKPLKGEGSHWHYHPEMELTLFTTGRGDRFTGDHIGHFAEGDLVLLGGMLPHHWHAAGKTSGLSLQWHFPADHPLWQLPEADGLRELFQRAAGGLRLTGEVHGRIAGMMEELAGLKGLARFGRFVELLATLAAAPPGELEALASRSFLPPADATYQESMSRVLRHLVRHFREEIRMAEVLKIAGLTKPTFSRQFRRHTGRSLSDFLIGIRLQAACRELSTTSRSVLDVALGCGFTQVSFFNRAFRRAMGCSPSEYRALGGSLQQDRISGSEGSFC
jgi:AraC-like DNA-binding protein